jgi:XTP/dITP diphosphohydrolase
MLRIKNTELQSDSLTEIAKNSAFEIFEKYNIPIIVEDSGLFIESLNGFPGPYAAYVYKTIGNNGIIKLMEKIKNRKAVFKSTIAFCDNNINEPISFEGEIFGIIASKPIQPKTFVGFGFDPIFQPIENLKLFSLMSITEKNLVSHRGMAFRKFAKWYSIQ